MTSTELYNKYNEAFKKRIELENKINEIVEKWKNGETVLSTESVEQALEKGEQRLEELKNFEQQLHDEFMRMTVLEEQKRSADISIASKLGERPTDMVITGGVLAPNASDSHLTAEHKTPEQLNNDKAQLEAVLKEKVKNGEISLNQASKVLNDLTKSYDFYTERDEISNKHL